jgi:UDP-N-acetylmuramate--alanine ligase
MSTQPQEKAQGDRFRELLARKEGRVHFVGIGGVGMAGLARHLAHRGFTVSGSDAVPSRITEWLKQHGIPVAHGHSADQIPQELLCVIRTPAVPDDNPEIRAAYARCVPVIPRGAALPGLLEATRSIAVAGTHGKTTTAAMIAQVLHSAGKDPSYCVGGEIDALDGVAGVGKGGLMVVEADESDGTLRLYAPDIGVITNIEFDHMEHFASETEFFACFESYISNVRGTAIYCGDDDAARRVSSSVGGALAYGFRDGSDVQGRIKKQDESGTSFTFRFGLGPWEPAHLPVPGVHNVRNALGAIAAARVLGIETEAIAAGLAAFRPVRRRFEEVGGTGNVRVITDYAHHPTEIAAVIETARILGPRRLVAIYQPHRYTRTLALRDTFPPAFEGVDELVLVPVYAASESPVPGGTSEDLYAAFAGREKPSVQNAPSLEAAWEWIRAMLEPGDLFLILGAGDVDKVASWAAEGLSLAPAGSRAARRLDRSIEMSQ